mmetsp:Transcript_25607/g.39357  ORF Transcript_25607/g.39357 Transcript_25607/m.39357 type:complete len:635 (-) Transcript_25607:107-2011(-)
MDLINASCPDGVPFAQPTLPIDLSWWGGDAANRTSITCEELTRDILPSSNDEDDDEEYHTYLFYCGCNVPHAEKDECPGICANGQVLDPLYHEEYVSDLYGTCGDLALMAAYFAVDQVDDSYQQICAGFTYFGQKVCGCSTTPPPPPQDEIMTTTTTRCEICEDGSIVNPDNINGDCLFMSGFAFAVSSDDPECSLHQGNAGVYCGCNNPVASEGVCRICGDDTLLPFPDNTETSLLGTINTPENCWALETRENEEFNLPACDVIREAVYDECCNPPPTCPDGTAFPHPDLLINLAWWSDGANTNTVYCKDLTPESISVIGDEIEYNLYLHYCGCTVEGSDCPGICQTPGETLKPEYHEAFVSENLGSCGDLALYASWYAVDNFKDDYQQSCAGFVYYGVNVCGCEPVLDDGANCDICEDGSLANPDELDGDCLFFAGAAYAETADSPLCQYYQGSAGVYCGCQNPIASQDVCRLCGDNILLPDAGATESSILGTDDLSNCWQLESTASIAEEYFGGRTCDETRSAVSEECCTVPSNSPTLSPSDTASVFPTTPGTIAETLDPVTAAPITPTTPAPTIDPSSKETPPTNIASPTSPTFDISNTSSTALPPVVLGKLLFLVISVAIVEIGGNLVA